MPPQQLTLPADESISHVSFRGCSMNSYQTTSSFLGEFGTGGARRPEDDGDGEHRECAYRDIIHPRVPEVGVSAKRKNARDPCDPERLPREMYARVTLPARIPNRGTTVAVI